MNARAIIGVTMTSLTLASGCIQPVYPGAEGAPYSTSRKQVAAKEAPTVLVAIDRFRCTTTEKRFQETEIGESVWCVWRNPTAP